MTTTAQKMKFSIKDIFSKCDQIRSLRKTSFFVQCKDGYSHKEFSNYFFSGTCKS